MFQGPIVIQFIVDTIKGIKYRRTKTSGNSYGKITVELIKPYKIENFVISPTIFQKLNSFIKQE